MCQAVIGDEGRSRTCLKQEAKKTPKKDIVERKFNTMKDNSETTSVSCLCTSRVAGMGCSKMKPKDESGGWSVVRCSAVNNLFQC